MTIPTLGAACLVTLPDPAGGMATHRGQVWSRWHDRVQVKLDRPALCCDPATARWVEREYVTVGMEQLETAMQAVGDGVQ